MSRLLGVNSLGLVMENSFNILVNILSLFYEILIDNN